MPCKFGGNSIVRGDAAFFDNDYWRGRIWGPHLTLIYWALDNAKYRDMPSVKAARGALVTQGRRLVLQEWDLFRQVTENYNGIIGAGEDVGNADPFYHCAFAFISPFIPLFVSPPPLSHPANTIA